MSSVDKISSTMFKGIRTIGLVGVSKGVLDFANRTFKGTTKKRKKTKK